MTLIPPEMTSFIKSTSSSPTRDWVIWPQEYTSLILRLSVSPSFYTPVSLFCPSVQFLVQDFVQEGNVGRLPGTDDSGTRSWRLEVLRLFYLKTTDSTDLTSWTHTVGSVWLRPSFLILKDERLPYWQIHTLGILRCFLDDLGYSLKPFQCLCSSCVILVSVKICHCYLYTFTLIFMFL